MAGSRWRRHVAGLALTLACLVAPLAASARGVTILRDPDIEYALGELAKPLIQAAGLSPTRVKIVVIQDSSLNAFVANADYVFIHSGLILKLKTPGELQAVIAHELAHIANGHLTTRVTNADHAGTMAKMGLVLAAAAAAATDTPELAAGIAVGTANTAHRAFLAHTRAEESSADQSAIRFMTSAGIDPSGMADVLEIFRGQEALSAGRQDPYLRTHPLSRDRLRAAEGYAAASSAYGTAASPENVYWFNRARGKLEGFIRNPTGVLRAVGKGDDDISRLRRAAAYHNIPDEAKAIAEIGALVARRPSDPYFAELQGQILLESGNTPAAVTAYRRAAELAPKNALILAGYGRALLALDTGDSNRRALTALQGAYARDPYNPRMLRDLGLAYARAGQDGMASLSIAERYALLGQLQDAAVHANRASGLLSRGSTGWNKAQDILHASQLQAAR